MVGSAVVGVVRALHECGGSARRLWHRSCGKRRMGRGAQSWIVDFLEAAVASLATGELYMSFWLADEGMQGLAALQAASSAR